MDGVTAIFAIINPRMVGRSKQLWNSKNSKCELISFRILELMVLELFWLINSHTHTHRCTCKLPHAGTNTHTHTQTETNIGNINDRFSVIFFLSDTYVIIIIMSSRRHGYPWASLATSPYHSSPLAGLQGYILCPHIAAVCKFELVVLLLLGHMWRSIGVHHLWARPCFSSSVLCVWFV